MTNSLSQRERGKVRASLGLSSEERRPTAAVAPAAHLGIVRLPAGRMEGVQASADYAPILPFAASAVLHERNPEILALS